MRNNKIVTFLLTALLVLTMSSLVFAQPTGTDITLVDSDSVAVSPPDNRTDAGGTINTLVVDAIQQNPRWKAYVGNITGSLTLSDSLGNTIFDWALDQSDITGEIYSSRSDSVDWGTISCASAGTITSEHTALNMSGTAIDNIANTFNETTHPSITVGTTTVSGCFATSTFVNSARQAQGSADFPIVLIQDTSDLIYVSPINPSTTGYDGASSFDFQMILANNQLSATTYYFYVELGGG